jgi:hypothetical protein
MSGIQHSSLSDDEFERQVYMTMVMGALPPEVAQELAKRQTTDREKERSAASLNPKQQPLPFSE